jgi:hypothetical protein
MSSTDGRGIEIPSSVGYRVRGTGSKEVRGKGRGKYI